MAISKEDILETVGSMTVMDLNDLVKAFEEKFGVSAAAMAVAGPAPVRAARRRQRKSRPSSSLAAVGVTQKVEVIGGSRGDRLGPRKPRIWSTAHRNPSRKRSPRPTPRRSRSNWKTPAQKPRSSKAVLAGWAGGFGPPALCL
jgi:hypothetical protein